MRELRISTLAANAEANAIGAVLVGAVSWAPPWLRLGLIALVVHLLRHRIARVTVGVLVDGPRAETERRREDAGHEGRAPPQLVRIVLLSTHEDTLSRL